MGVGALAGLPGCRSSDKRAGTEGSGGPHVKIGLVIQAGVYVPLGMDLKRGYSMP